MKVNLDNYWGEPDEEGVRPIAAAGRIETCERFGLEPDQADLDCLARADARASAVRIATAERFGFDPERADLDAVARATKKETS